jgi:hypothetical protein
MVLGMKVYGTIDIIRITSIITTLGTTAKELKGTWTLKKWLKGQSLVMI